MSSRLRLVAFFSLLLLGCVAAPVLAQVASTDGPATASSATEDGVHIAIADAQVASEAPTESESAPEPEQSPAQPSPEPPKESPVVQPPEGNVGEGEVGQLLPEAQADEAQQRAEREEFLSSPAAVAERLASEFAYTDISGVQAEEILRDRFAPQLKSIDSDPSRILADVALKRVESPTEALVETEGETMLLESEVPIRAPEEKGEMKKVDLGLEETESGYAAANPIVDLTLPKTASGSIAIGDKGVAITPEGMNSDSAAQRFGREDIFLPEVAEDTGMLLSPITGGVEISTMVLSRKSPEQFAFSVTLPEGAALKTDESGGAVVVSEKGQSLAAIRAPRAVDAQGTPAPVKLAVKGNSIVLEVPHRSMDIAYPALIDPEIEENWWEFADTSKLYYWNWSANVGLEDYIGQRSYIVTNWGNGLYVRSRSNFFYPGGSWGRWWFSPQGSTTYMHRVVLGPMHLDAHGCTANEPHPYVGVWNNGGYWSVLSNAYPSGWGTWIDSGGGNLGAGARTAFVGIEAAANTNIKCGRDYNLGGATLFLDDPENPSAGASGIPTWWIGNGATFTANVSGYDPGLGIRRMTLHPQGQKTYEDNVGCNGHYSSQCPGSRGWSLGLGAGSLDEGVQNLDITSEDALGKFSAPYNTKTKVDLEGPEVDLQGQFAEATAQTGKEQKAQGLGDDELSFPIYNLEIKATDGTAGNLALERSGVKSIEVFLEGKSLLKEPVTNPSPCDSCGKTIVVPVSLTELSPETPYTLEVIAKDQLNQSRKREIVFEYVPATGIKDEYIMQRFPLPDGQSHEDPSEAPEIAVNLMNGNLVYRQLDIDIEGPNVDLKVERFFNSQLPTAENTEWGDGWTLAQTPRLEPVDTGGSPAPDVAKLVETSGAIKGEVDLPTETGQTQFKPELQSTITREADGGYELANESGESSTAVAFNSSGQVDEMRTDGPAKIEYDYEAGDLSEIAVDDPTASSEDPPVPPALPAPGPLAYQGTFGTTGSGNGQFNRPADIARDAKGQLWVANENNNRIDHFNEKGEYLGKIGSGLSAPAGVAIDSKGNFWIVEKGGARVSEFNEKGEFIRKFGSSGSGNGQFREPEGIAVDPDGNVWVADTYNARLQVFNEKGEYLKTVGSYGSGPGQFIEPCGLDFGPGGHLWVADWSNNRVTEFDQNGAYVNQFGSKGTGDGQLEQPFAVDVDASGVVWVSDSGNNRVQAFDQDGGFIRKFGSKGSGAGQFSLSYPVGIATDAVGQIWVTDTSNNRISRWVTPTFEIEEELIEAAEEPNDPAVDVNVSSGLVNSVEGEEAGKTTYAYSGDDLVAAKGSGGEVKYETDSGGRLTKVVLPNGTEATIKYEPTYHRVSAVTVNPAGPEPAKTTGFEYINEPRRTVVTPPNSPVVTYDFAPDGAFLRYRNAVKPPEILLGGSLFEKRESSPIEIGLHNLVVNAHSEEGIASIIVVAGGDTIVSEQSCSQNLEVPGIECKNLPDEWIAETANLQPGIMQVEVEVEDRLEHIAEQRFWVNIPYTPPPAPDELSRPTFAQIKLFRENYGLDRDLNPVLNELEIDNRIFDLIGAWNNPQSPEGAVARSSAEQWGVPLRPTDVAEMQYREWYIGIDGPLIEEWAEANHPGTFAGYYVDHRNGGLIYIGFTQNQTQVVSELKAQVGLVAGNRISGAPVQPTVARFTLASLSEAVESEWVGNSQLRTLITEVWVDEAANRVHVGAKDVGQVEGLLALKFGTEMARLSIVYQPEPIGLASDRFRTSGRIVAGDNIQSANSGCSAGYGAFENRVKQNGEEERRKFLLTGGHCFPLDTAVVRSPSLKGTSGFTPVGEVTRRAWNPPGSLIGADGEAIKLTEDGLRPTEVAYKAGGINPPTFARKGETLCFVGAITNQRRCGEVLVQTALVPPGQAFLIPVYVIKQRAEHGDSGGPVWNPNTGASIGLVQGGNGRVVTVAPLLHLPGQTQEGRPGILRAGGMSDLTLLKSE